MGRREICRENHIDQPQIAPNYRVDGSLYIYDTKELVLCFRPFIYCRHVFR
jgi:hypothetical protein